MKMSAWVRLDGPIAIGLASCAILLGAGSPEAQTSDLVSRSSLRVCADPANLPFSDEAGQGFENKIAELVAAEFGLPLDYTWYPQATGFVRNTLGAKRCDVVMGYAAGSDPVQNTNPYYRSAWVLVHPKGAGLDGVESLEDPRLKDKRLGVVAGTPPATILAKNGMIGRAKPYHLVVDRRYESPAEEMIHDIEAGEIDGGLLWGPIGGYYAKRSEKLMTVVPLVREPPGPPMAFWITMGVRSGEDDWKHRLNQFIADHQAVIRKILLDYGVPLIDDQNRPVTAP